MEKKLYRSNSDRAICGVCGGIAQYFDIDVVIIRLLAVILGFGSFGTLLIGYIIAAVVIPDEPTVRMSDGEARNVYETTYEYKTENGETVYESQAADAEQTDAARQYAGQGEKKHTSSRGNGWLIGLILIAIGAYWLLDIFVPFMDMRIVGAGLLILLGILVLVKK